MSAQHTVNPHKLASAPIVVGVDGSDASDLAVSWAAETAIRRGRALRLVHGLNLAAAQAVVGMYDLMVPAVAATLREDGAAMLATAARLAHRIDADLRVETELSPAHPARLLCEKSQSAHMVVLGAGHGGEIAHIGSTLLAVTAHGHGDIVVVRDTGSDQRTRTTGPVVLGLDDNRVSQAAVAAAFAEAGLRGTTLIAAHAASGITFHPRADITSVLPARELEAAAQQVLAEGLAGWQEKFPEVPVTRKVSVASPRNLLTVLSKSAQLVVVGSRGRGGFRGLLLGSTSNFLVQHAHCPVMVSHER
ncbi:universal stress protein [Nocardia bhagyanarayanae]|uniref:Nucleotide-binding universal stress UspA family protein n=1 Tax=Nocardia bhagyanarayanae TaxID=1215925 RepID=A0A543FFH8_9NOCA|nr:universal stress protein [Nocardia bhagyanarayanae]TQM32522.1 nucleotide-binding universal stress UspA family protein [Nocardia bhagyanarayanae]